MIGEIVGTHGVRGEARMRPFNPSSRVLDGASEVFLVHDGSRVRGVSLDHARPHRGFWLLAIEGISAPEDARRLVGDRVAVRERTLPSLEAGQFYCYQLIGLEVMDARGASVGRVADVLETGGNDVLVVRDGAKEHLIPMAGPFISEIDVEARRIVIRPIDGLLASR